MADAMVKCNKAGCADECRYCDHAVPHERNSLRDGCGPVKCDWHTGNVRCVKARKE